MSGLSQFIQNYFVPQEKAKAQSEVARLRKIVSDLKEDVVQEPKALNGEAQPSPRLSREAEMILEQVEPYLQDAENALTRGDHAKALDHAHQGFIKFENVY